MKCTCDICLHGGPVEPHTDSSSFLLSQQEADRLNSRGWSELVALYDIYAPFSICRSQDAIAAPPMAEVEPVSDTSIAIHEGDWRVPVAHEDIGTIDGSSRFTEEDVTAGVIHLATPLQ